MVALMALLALSLVVVPAPAAVPSGDAETAIVPAFAFHASHGYRAIGWAAPAHSGDPAQLLLIFGRKHASAGFLVGIGCPGGGYGWSAPGRGGQLVARSSPRAGTFKAIKRAPRARSYFSATIDERRGGVRISRYVSASGPASDFVFPRRGQRAHASPPPPFSGSSSLSVGGWRGSLSVDFPGHSNARLSGPGFRAHLLHARFSGSIARGLE